MSYTITAMIPVLLGSTRVPNKNILLIDGKVLCSYVIEACRDSNVFTDIWLNSEDEIFLEIAQNAGVEFYARPPEWGGSICQQHTKSKNCNGKRCTLNEHYLYNFMKRGTKSDYVCQVNSTSPLLKPETITNFVNRMTAGEFDSFFTTVQIRAESFIDGEEVTFSRHYKQPSQELKPIDSICWSIAGWNRKKFLESYERDDINEAGPIFGGKLGLMPIDEREALDIDEWSTVDIIEKYLGSRRQNEVKVWKYIDGKEISEQSF